MAIDPGAHDGISKSTHLLWPQIKRTLGTFSVLVGLFIAFQRRERLASLIQHLPKYERQAALEEQRPPTQPTNDRTPEPPAKKPNSLRPTDYGV